MPLDDFIHSPVSPACVTVISVIGPNWDTSRRVCNHLAGRRLFTNDPEDCDIHYALCDSVFYLIALDSCINSAVVENLEKRKEAFTNILARGVEYDSLKNALFLFLCSHVVIMVNESRAISLRHFRTLSILQSVKGRIEKDLRKLDAPPAWPGHCSPWLLLVFSRPTKQSTIQAANSQAVSLLQASRLRNGPACLFRCDLPYLFDGLDIPASQTRYGEPSADDTVFTPYVEREEAISKPSIFGQDHQNSKGDSTYDFLLDHERFAVLARPPVPSPLVTTVQKLVQKVDGNMLNLSQWCISAQKIAQILGMITVDTSEKEANDGVGLMRYFSVKNHKRTAADAGNHTHGPKKDKEKKILTSGDTGGISKGKKPSNVNSKSNRGGGGTARDRKRSKDVNLELVNLDHLEFGIKLEDKFMKMRCEAAFPIAVEVYRSKVPALYNSRLHGAVLDEAMKTFRKLSGGKGLISKRYESRVADSCRKIWQGPGIYKDRRLCDSVSLTGFPCKLLRRECLGKDKTIDLAKCRSGVIHKLSCSCGRTTIERADPFDEVTGNVNDVTLNCCKGMISLDLKSKIERNRYVPLNEFRKGLGGEWVLHRHGGVNSYNPDMGVTAKGFIPGYNRLERWAPLEEFPEVYIGLEYLCLSDGRRHFFTMPGLSKDRDKDTGTKSQNAKKPSGEWIEGEKVFALWPEIDVQIFLSSAIRTKSTEGGYTADDVVMFQLSRVWLYIGVLDASQPGRRRKKLSLHATISASDNMIDNNSLTFTHGLKPMLPKGNLFCLCLPRIYRKQENQANAHSFSINSTTTLNEKPFESRLVLKRGLLRMVDSFG